MRPPFSAYHDLGAALFFCACTISETMKQADCPRLPCTCWAAIALLCIVISLTACTAQTHAAISTSPTSSQPELGSSCTIDATPGILFKGGIWPSWIPLKDVGSIPPYLSWSQKDIPSRLQNQSTTVGECNCQCIAVPACVGYTWLGGRFRQCWLHSRVDFWATPDSNVAMQPLLSDETVPVPGGTVLARAVRGHGAWPQCSGGMWFNVNSSRDNNGIIYRQPTGASLLSTTHSMTRFACNKACGDNPLCVAISWVAADTTAAGNVGSTASCHLHSGLTAQPAPAAVVPLLTSPGVTVVAPLQTCLIGMKQTLAELIPPPAPAPAPPAPPSPPGAKYGTCNKPAYLGIRFQGQVIDGWQPDAKLRLLAVMNAGPWPARLQGSAASSYGDCNCRCANFPDACVGYTWLGGSFKQCWLHSWMDLTSGATDTVGVIETSKVPQDTVVARVVAFTDSEATQGYQQLVRQGAASCSDGTPLQLAARWSFVNAASRDIRWNLTAAVPLPNMACNAACLYDPACIAYSWKAPLAFLEAKCTLYSDVAPALPNPQVFPDTVLFSGLLQSCYGAAAVAQLRDAPSDPPAKTLPASPTVPAAAPGPASSSVTSSSCGIDYTQGIRYTGHVWPGWVPVKTYGADSSTAASNLDIPEALQGNRTASVAECNCRCVSVSGCVGYTWLPDRQQCWLHSMVNFFQDPVTSFMDPEDNTTAGLSQVPAGTVLARVVTNASMPGNSATFQDQLALSGCEFSRLVDAVAVASSPLPPGVHQMTPRGCMQECVINTACTGITYTSTNEDLLDPAAMCTLLTNTSGGLVTVNPSGSQHTFTASLQTCPTPVTAPAPSPTPAPAPPPALTCTGNASLGILYHGAVWPDWQPVKGAGWKVDMAGAGNSSSVGFHTPAWSNAYIADDQQGLPAGQVEECNCRCATAPTCVGYTWLGPEDQACWLHSWVAFFTAPSLTLGDGSAAPAGAVIGRVIKTASNWPVCQGANSLQLFNKTAFKNFSTQGITRPTEQLGDISPGRCNQECGQDPACVAFSLHTSSTPDTGLCKLYSHVSGAPTFNNGSHMFVPYAATLQAACLQALGQSTTPSALDLSAAPAAAELFSSKSLSTGAVIGIVLGSVCGVSAIIGVVVAVWLRRRHGDPWASGRFFGSKKDGSASQGSTWMLGVASATDKHLPMDVPGLAKGEIFTRATAFEYSWLSTPVDLSSAVAVEAGITDTNLDALLKGASSTAAGEKPPVVELSKAQLREQVQLVHGGLLGRGATALVFQCVWPSRFGPSALLACKVLKDGHEVDPLVLQSFAYEANVLASTEHPCVIRLYGYCLEPPCVCLILELLPYSLKDLLYGPSTHTSLQQLAVSVPTSQLLLGTGSSQPVPSTPMTPASTLPDTATDQQAVLAAAVQITATDGVQVEEPAPKDSALISTASNVPLVDTRGSKSLSDQASAPSQDATSDPASVKSPCMVVCGTCGPANAKCDKPQTSHLSMLQVLKVSTEVASGLAYLHDRPAYIAAGHAGHAVLSLDEGASAVTNMGQGSKIVHRDLKPANVLINSQGRAKISDFGLARRTQRSTMHTERLGAGTLPYMAPELLAGAHAGRAGFQLNPTNKVDIYSLALMMYEMLAGKQPWSDKNEVAIMSAVIRNQRPELPVGPKTAAADIAKVDLQQLPAGLDRLPEFNSIIRACWNQRESKRPTAAACFNMLAEILQHHGYVAAPELVPLAPTPVPQETEEP